MTPTSEPFLASKSMILILLGISAIILLIIAAIVVKIIWKVDVFAEIGIGVGGITAHTTGGVVRNMQVDGPVRQAQAGIMPNTMQAAPPVPGSLGAPPV